MKFNRLFTITAVLTLFALPALADKGNKQRGASFDAALVRAADVNTPASLLTIAGADPLRAGSAELTKQGHIQVRVLGALPNVSYDLIYRSLDGRSERTLGSLATNPAGNANFELQNFFLVNDAGAGTVLLRRNGLNQFLTGFQAAAAKRDEDADDEGDDEGEEARFEAGLVRLAEVNQPATLSTHGTDPLGRGKAEIDASHGSVKVEVDDVAPNATYDVVFRSFDASGELAIGSLTTDSKGDGEIEQQSLFAANAVGAGNIVLKRNRADQFVTGFKIASVQRHGHGRHHH